MFVEVVEVFGDVWLSVGKFRECFIEHLCVQVYCRGGSVLKEVVGMQFLSMGCGTDCGVCGWKGVGMVATYSVNALCCDV